MDNENTNEQSKNWIGSKNLRSDDEVWSKLVQSLGGEIVSVHSRHIIEFQNKNMRKNYMTVRPIYI